MDPKLQDAYDALQAAHEAGNTADATQLADYIETLKAQSSTDLSPQAADQRNDPLYGAGSGAILGAALGTGSKALDFASAVKNLGAQKTPLLQEPVPPTSEYFAPGQKYSAKTGYGSGPGESVESVVLHKAEEKKPLGRGKISSKILGPTRPEDILALSAQKEADAAVHARILAQERLKHEAEKDAFNLKQKAYLNQQNKLLQEKKFGIPNAIGTTKAVTGATMGYNAMDIYNQLHQGDPAQAALSGVGMVSGAAPYIKQLPPKLRALGTALSIGAPLVNRTIDAAKGQADGGPVQHFSRGKEVLNLVGKAVSAKAPLAAQKNAPLWLKHGYDPVKIGNQYPDVIPPVLAKDPKTGKEFYQKANSPEALAVQKARNAAQKQIDAGDYQPHFDVDKRYYADPTHYPTAGKTLTDVVPKKADTIAKYTELANDPEALARLRGAFEKAKDRPAAKDWYAMGQLEDAFIKELGPVEGRKQFKARFADAMAATTGGADPNSNLMMAAFTNYQKALGHAIPEKAADLPFPVGGRFVSGNMEQANKLAQLGQIPVTNPKRHNFSANFLGHRDVSTLDEQMSQLWDPKMMSPPPNAYGIYEQALANEAKKAGVNPVNFQDIAWAGAKDYPGKAMMTEINEMLARTSKMTGQPQEDVLKGFIRSDKPMYGIGALGLGEAASQDDAMSNHAEGGEVQHFQAGKRVLNAAINAIKEGAEPKDVVKAYKLFRTDPKVPNSLYPLFVNANEQVPLGKWVDATAGTLTEAGKVKSKIGDLAYRPGWHAGEMPVATHIGGKSDPTLKAPDYRPGNQVWAEVDMPNDVDWQTIANQRAQLNKAGQPISRTAHITDQVPEGGHYRYKTNPNMTGDWLIGGSMKVNKVLTDDEVKAINEGLGVSDLPRIEGKKVGGKIGALEMIAQKVLPQAERQANKATFLQNKHPSVPDMMYHGTAADINQFVPKQAGATFLTSSPRFAGSFSDASEHHMMQQLQKKLSSDEIAKLNDKAYKLSKKTGDSPTDLYQQMLKEQLPTGQNIMPVHVNATNPFDYENPEHIENLRQYLKSKNSTQQDSIPDSIKTFGDWKVTEMPITQQAIKNMGHDSFWVKEGGQKNLGIYDPNQIKSATGNVGTYDTTIPDITKKRGGLA